MENLKKVGADVNLDTAHMFLKDKANPPAYLRTAHADHLDLHDRAVQVRHRGHISTTSVHSSPTSATSTRTWMAATPIAVQAAQPDVLRLLTSSSGG
ncbi:hypothetical protein E4K10_43040 [Streptomyces sp. T1317-0309]|nr:hypothetical protein E4K10_43040 [Streptomyces sp. T1317-0309]